MNEITFAGNIPLKRDGDGMGFHPAFPWDSVPEETSIVPYIKKWGYEGVFVSMDTDAPDEIQRRYEDSGEVDCSYWTPTKPKGEGWFLAAVYDTEDGPVAMFLKLITPNPMTTTELKSARIQWMAAHSNILDIYMSAMDDPDELEKGVTRAEQFIAASKNLIQELRQKEGVA